MNGSRSSVSVLSTAAVLLENELQYKVTPSISDTETIKRLMKLLAPALTEKHLHPANPQNKRAQYV